MRVGLDPKLWPGSHGNFEVKLPKARSSTHMGDIPSTWSLVHHNLPPMMHPIIIWGYPSKLDICNQHVRTHGLTLGGEIGVGQFVHLWKKTIIFWGPLIVVMPVGALHIDVDQQKMKQHHYSCQWQHTSHLPLNSINI